jgi:hypothetical protein
MGGALKVCPRIGQGEIAQMNDQYAGQEVT